MNSEAHDYAVLIMNLRTIGRKIDYALNYINRFERYILSGFVVNENISFDGDLENLKNSLTAKRDQIFNSIIPALEMEMQAAATR